jgi:hypothetical protein
MYDALLRAGTDRPASWAEHAYQLGIAYRDKNQVTAISDQMFCAKKIKEGRFHRNEFNLYKDPNHGLPYHDWDHQTWFRDAQGRFIFTSQPYCPPEGRTAMEARHKAIADRLEVAFRMSAEESWWCPGETVLLEFRQLPEKQ